MGKLPIQYFLMLLIFTINATDTSETIKDHQRKPLNSGCCSNTFPTQSTNEYASNPLPFFNLWPVSRGGTGLTTIAQYAIVVGNNNTTLDVIAPGTSGLALIANGPNALASYQEATVPSGGTGNNSSFNLNSVLIGNNTDPILVTLPGIDGVPLVSANPGLPDFSILNPIGGGTGKDNLTTNYLLSGNGTDPVNLIDTTSTDQALVSNGAGSPATFGVLPVVGGGTGQINFTQYGILYGNGTSGLGVTAAGTTGQPLLSNGGASAPAFGTAPVNGGGTGLNTLTAYALLVGNGTSALNFIGPDITENKIFASNGALANSSFKQLSIAVQTFTASGVYTPSSGMTCCFIECIGGGGAGGGCSNATSLIASGGGSGGYSAAGVVASAIGTSKAVTIGSGGIPSNGIGGSGGATFINPTSITIRANGGSGGLAGSTNALAGGAGATTLGAINPILAGTSGAGTTGTATLQGLLSGEGASCLYGQGGAAVPLINSGAIAGNNGMGYGSGGSGATSGIGSFSSAQGGAGASGIIIITEFILS